MGDRDCYPPKKHFRCILLVTIYVADGCASRKNEVFLAACSLIGGGAMD